MDSNKKRVENYFATDRGFASGKTLYGALPNKSIAFLNSLNRMSDTPANCARLHYELGKLGGFNQRGLKILLQKPLVEKDVEESDESTDGKVTELDPFAIPEFSKGLPGLAERKKFAKKNKIEVTGKKGTDFDASFETWREVQINEAIREAKAAEFKAMPEPVKKSLKLREQFPFLSEDDCPDVYKILTADLSTTYDKYQKAHEDLFKDSPAEALLEAIKDVVVPYKENKLIWAELEHYQTKGESLGKHPVFAELARKEELRNMDGDALATVKGNLKSNISKTKKLIKDAGDSADSKLKAKLEKFQQELKFVTKLLKGKK